MTRAHECGKRFHEFGKYTRYHRFEILWFQVASSRLFQIVHFNENDFGKVFFNILLRRQPLNCFMEVNIFRQKHGLILETKQLTDIVTEDFLKHCKPSTKDT